MPTLDSSVISSNDYVDILVTRAVANSETFQETYGEFPRMNLNFDYSATFIPRSEFPKDLLQAITYRSIPKLFTLMDTVSLEASGITQVQQQPVLELTGRGILLGFIDTGIDYTHPAFLDSAGKTRILAIWDQTDNTGTPPDLFPYGSEYNNSQINQALSSDNPLSIVPQTDDNGHGTMMAGIACGSPSEQNSFLGAAYNSGILVVKLKEAKNYLKDYFFINGPAPAYQENDIMTAISWLIRSAELLRRPLVICIGLGSNQGGHDGYDPLSTTLTRLGNFPGIATVISGGNETGKAHHYYGTINTNNDGHTVEINVPENSGGFTVELWGQAPQLLSVGFQTPVGETIPRISARLQHSEVISFILERTRIYVNYEIIQSSGGQLILLRFEDPTPGVWKIMVYSSQNTNDEFHLWLPVSGFSQPDIIFLSPNQYTTITIPGYAHGGICVSTYDAYQGGIYLNSGRGYGRLANIKPDFAAPGVNLLGPGLNQDYIRATGGSISVALAAGGTALLMEWGINQNPKRYYTSFELRTLLIRGAERSSTLTYPNREWGYGAMNIYQVFTSLMTN